MKHSLRHLYANRCESNNNSTELLEPLQRLAFPAALTAHSANTSRRSDMATRVIYFIFKNAKNFLNICGAIRQYASLAAPCMRRRFAYALEAMSAAVLLAPAMTLSLQAAS